MAYWHNKIFCPLDGLQLSCLEILLHLFRTQSQFIFCFFFFSLCNSLNRHQCDRIWMAPILYDKNDLWRKISGSNGFLNWFVICYKCQIPNIFQLTRNALFAVAEKKEANRVSVQRTCNYDHPSPKCQAMRVYILQYPNPPR